MRFYSCRRLLLHLCHLCQQLLICHLSGFSLLVFFKQLVDNLAFLQTTVSHCCIDCIPVTETVLADDLLHKFRFQKIAEDNFLGLAVTVQKILTPDDIFFFELCLKPLIDLVLGLSTLDNTQPVTAWSLGIG